MIHVGNYLIKGVIISLEMVRRRYRPKKDEIKSYGFEIQLPDNYPDTELKRRIKDEPYLFYLDFATEDNKDLDNLPLVDKNIHIRNFYFQPTEKQIPLIEDEKVAFRGLGKRCLCLALNLLFKGYEMGVILEAYGSIEIDRKYEEYIRSLSRKKLIAHIKSELAWRIDFDYDEDLNVISHGLLENFKSLLMDVHNNKMLAKYYERNFGFSEFKDDNIFIGIKMGCYLSTLLDKCQKSIL